MGLLLVLMLFLISDTNSNTDFSLWDAVTLPGGHNCFSTAKSQVSKGVCETMIVACNL